MCQGEDMSSPYRGCRNDSQGREAKWKGGGKCREDRVKVRIGKNEVLNRKLE